MYRYTKEQQYLLQAQRIADFIIHHPRFPVDGIPYWDFDAPNILDTYRDASAGTVMCSALIELSGYVSLALRKEYLVVAERQLRTLCSLEYKNRPGSYANFLLRHSVGSIPHNSEIDVPLSYADYYYVEALMRMKDIVEKK